MGETQLVGSAINRSTVNTYQGNQFSSPLIVCNYYPGGNYYGQYTTNVKAPAAPGTYSRTGGAAQCTAPAYSATPGAPGAPGVPAVPGAPGAPGVPAVPGAPGVPGVPSGPANPLNPLNP